MRWPSASVGLAAGSYGRRAPLEATGGSEPSVVNHGCATPQPPVSDAVSVAVMALGRVVAETSSVVDGAALSTFAAGEVRTASTWPTLWTEAERMPWPLPSTGFAAAS